MASIKITELTSSGPLTGSEVLPIVQGSQTVKTTAQDIANLGGGGLEGTNYVYVAANGTDVENAAELQAAYNTAKTMSPSATNRITVIAAPGKYNFDSSYFTMDTEYIDLVSLDGNRSIVLTGNPIFDLGIYIQVNNIYVKGVDTKSQTFGINDNLNFLKVENCKAGGANSFGGSSPSWRIPGVFINCEAENSSFIGETSGTFIDCKVGNNSFGGNFSQISGVFINCEAGNNSFGDLLTVIAGTLNNCIAGFQSFGGNSGAITGKLFYCRLTSGTFQTVSGGGVTVLCIDGNNQINTQN